MRKLKIFGNENGGTTLELSKSNSKILDLELKNVKNANSILKPKFIRQVQNLDISENNVGTRF